MDIASHAGGFQRKGFDLVMWEEGRIGAERRAFIPHYLIPSLSVVDVPSAEQAHRISKTSFYGLNSARHIVSIFCGFLKTTARRTTFMLCHAVSISIKTDFG
jgi:hypothetical protein